MFTTLFSSYGFSTFSIFTVIFNISFILLLSYALSYVELG